MDDTSPTDTTAEERARRAGWASLSEQQRIARLQPAWDAAAKRVRLRKVRAALTIMAAMPADERALMLEELEALVEARP